jgi:hypothetical protein
LRQRDREGKAGEARSGADVGDSTGVGELRDLEPGEAVGNVGGERIFGPADGGRGVGLGGERVDEEGQAIGRSLGQVVADREPGGRFP